MQLEHLGSELFTQSAQANEQFKQIGQGIDLIQNVAVQTQSDSTEQINRHIENIHSISKELKHYADLI